MGDNPIGFPKQSVNKEIDFLNFETDQEPHLSGIQIKEIKFNKDGSFHFCYTDASIHFDFIHGDSSGHWHCNQQKLTLIFKDWEKQPKHLFKMTIIPENCVFPQTTIEPSDYLALVSEKEVNNFPKEIPFECPYLFKKVDFEV